MLSEPTSQLPPLSDWGYGPDDLLDALKNPSELPRTEIALSTVYAPDIEAEIVAVIPPIAAIAGVQSSQRPRSEKRLVEKEFLIRIGRMFAVELATMLAIHGMPAAHRPAPFLRHF